MTRSSLTRYAPLMRERRLRQMSPERRARAERNAREIAEMIGGAR